MFKKKFPSLSSLGSDGNTAFLRAARAGHLDKVLEHLKSNIDINTSNSNGLNALHLASKDGHVNVVTELLKRGAVVDAATKKGNTALHIASLAGQEEVVKLLVANGAAVNVQSQNGFTPLYMAAQENHDNVVRFLLSNGANQSLATEDGFTPLAVAMQQGHDKVVTVLLENDTRGKVRLPALHIAAKKDDCKAAALLLQNDHNPDVTSKSGFTPLHIAAHYGNERIANLLLTRGADVNYSAKHNITPLHVAAKWGKTNMVSLLLEKGANIESKTRDGLTPLHCAARSGHEQVVDMMLERGAPISSKTKNGLAPLHMASQGDHVDAARILLYHRAPVDEVTVDYLTALHVAAHCGHVRVAKLLLDRKADPNARALNGFTPLHIACKKNRIKVVELLLKHGASIEATTESGLTPLHVASFMGCMNIVIYLLQHEANPDVPTVRGETPLHLAARANQTDIIRILLRNDAQVDARAREQQTPLHIASRLGNVDIVMLLLQHGAAVDSTTKDMYTALHIAGKEGQEEVASVLLEHGASLTATTKKGFTPLHLAAKYGNMKVAKLLLQRDAPVDAQGKNGVTPLHVASHYDHQNVALLLLDKGASPHATAKNGHTPLHIAARKNQMDIATTLLEYGAKANAESKAGFTPLHLSAQEGHTDMSTLLIEHQADTNHKAKNGLTPLHLCAQEDRVNVAAILIKNNAEVDTTTKAGYTPLHVASHFGQLNMVRFLLQHGANVKAGTSIGYTPLHQAAQQGHTNILNLLLENGAQPNALTNQGQSALSIGQKLGYISVVETLKGVTDTTITANAASLPEEKYRVVAPETMQETFMSDSEDEGGEDTMLSDQPYRYLTVDEMKSLGDDSLPIDVTRDERMDSNRECMAPPTAVEDTISPQHTKESYSQFAVNYTPDNVDLARHPVHIGKLHWKNFLVSFLVDARGGAMRGCRHSGVRVIVPPRKAMAPMRVTCRYLKRDKLSHPPPLMEGEALASRILELGPVGAKFLGPVIIEVPHFGSLRGMEREIVILRSDNGETWREHTLEASEDAVHQVLNDSFEGEELSAIEEASCGRMTRILTNDFPQYFAVVSRIRQEVHAIGPEGGMVSSSVVPQVQAVFPQGALTKKIKVGLQAQPIAAELTAKLLGNRVAVSPIVTVEPRRRKFHKPITLTIPVPQAANKGMINQYSGDAPTLRLLCSITGGTTRAQWEDVTGSTPLTFVNDCVSFTTTVSARFWLMDCRNIVEATKMATELYKEAIHVPFMAKFVVFAKRVDLLEARLRVFCMTDDKEDKTLEHQEHFTEVAKSRDVEVLEGKSQYVELTGNLVPVTKSGDQLQLGFRAFRENRLPFTVRVKDPHADTVGRILFMREPKVAKGEPPQQPICILNIVLPETILPESGLSEPDLLALQSKYTFLRDGGLDSYQRTDLRMSDISNLLGEEWVPLANELDISTSDINMIKSELPSSVAQQAMAMLRHWLHKAGNKATGNALETALRKIGREDIVQQCIFNVDEMDRAVAKVQLDQSGFDTLKEELGPSRDASLRRDASLDITFDEQDIMKESESVEELVQAEKKEPLGDTKISTRSLSPKYSTEKQETDAEETKYIGEEKVVQEERRTVAQLKEIFAQDKRDRQYERQPSTGKLQEDTTTDNLEDVTVLRKLSSSEDGTGQTLATSTATTTTTTVTKVIIDDGVKTTTVEKTLKSVDDKNVTKSKSVRDEEAVKTTSTTGTEESPKQKQEAEQRRDSELFQGVSDELVRLETTYKVIPASEEILSPKVSKTPPPSPAEFKDSTGVTTWQQQTPSLVSEQLSAPQDWTEKLPTHDQDLEIPQSGICRPVVPEVSSGVEIRDTDVSVLPTSSASVLGTRDHVAATPRQISTSRVPPHTEDTLKMVSSVEIAKDPGGTSDVLASTVDQEQLTLAKKLTFDNIEPVLHFSSKPIAPEAIDLVEESLGTTAFASQPPNIDPFDELITPEPIEHSIADLLSSVKSRVNDDIQDELVALDSECDTEKSITSAMEEQVDIIYSRADALSEREKELGAVNKDISECIQNMENDDLKRKLDTGPAIAEALIRTGPSLIHDIKDEIKEAMAETDVMKSCSSDKTSTIKEIGSDASPYVTTPTLQRRGLGGSQRLSREQRPAPLDVSYLPSEDAQDEQDGYIVTEPGDDEASRRQQIPVCRVNSSPDILVEEEESSLAPSDQPALKRRPMFHIESEEDDISEQMIGGDMDMGDITLNINQQLEMASGQIITLTDADQEHKGGPKITKHDVLLESEDMQSIEIAHKEPGSARDQLDEDIFNVIEGVPILMESISKLPEESPTVSHIQTSSSSENQPTDRFLDLDVSLVDPFSKEEACTEHQEKKLRRVERRFERMASETLESDAAQGLTPEVEEKREAEFQRMLSQLSTEEVADCQKEYSQLWDEGGMTPSEDWDSHDPDTPCGELDDELPQQESSRLTREVDRQESPAEESLIKPQPKPSPRNVPKPDHDIALTPLPHSVRPQLVTEVCSEEHVASVTHRVSSPETVVEYGQSKQSTIPPNEIEENVQSYSDRKKFWEQMTTSQTKVGSTVTQAQPEVCTKDRSELASPPVPRPRSTITPSPGLIISAVPEGLAKSETESDTETTFSDSTIRIHPPPPCVSKQSTFTGSSDTSDREGSETEAVDINNATKGVPATATSAVAVITQKQYTEDSQSSDSETDYPTKCEDESMAFENKAFIEDDEVKTAVRDNGAFVPIISSHDRTKSVDEDAFDGTPVAATRKSVYERSVSLPTESLLPFDHNGSVRAKKRYFEAQIKKEMVVEQLMTQLEEEGSPEHKSIHQDTDRPSECDASMSGTIPSDIFRQGLQEQGIDYFVQEDYPTVRSLAKEFEKNLSSQVTEKVEIETSSFVTDETFESETKMREIPISEFVQKEYKEDVLKESDTVTDIDEHKTFTVKDLAMGFEKDKSAVTTINEVEKSFVFQRKDNQELECIDGLQSKPIEDLKVYTEVHDTEVHHSTVKDIRSVFENKLHEQLSTESTKTTSVKENEKQVTCSTEEQRKSEFTKEAREQLIHEHEEPEIVEHVYPSSHKSDSENLSEISETDNQDEIKTDIELGSREDLSYRVAEVMQYKSESICKASDSLEVHVDKSETEETEKEKDIDEDIKELEIRQENDSEYYESRKGSFTEDEPIPSITVTLSGKQRTESYSQGESEDTASESDVTPESAREDEHQLYQSEEHMPDTVWEVPVQEQPETIVDEVVHEIPLKDHVILEKDEEKKEFDYDMESDTDRITEDEARILAKEVVESIEDEVAKRTDLTSEYSETSSPPVPPPDIAESQVSNYLRKLTEKDDLEPREVQLMESVLARKHREQITKLSRTDTTTSSMEITDEDLRSSGVETDLSPLESHAGKLQALEDITLSEELITDIALDVDEYDKYNVKFDNDAITTKKMEEEVVEKTLAEVRESLEAAQEQLIEEHIMKEEVVQKKESPSEFEFKVLTFEKKIEDKIEESTYEEANVSDYFEHDKNGIIISQSIDIKSKERDELKEGFKKLDIEEVSYAVDGTSKQIDTHIGESEIQGVKHKETKFDAVIKETPSDVGTLSETRTSATFTDDEEILAQTKETQVKTVSDHEIQETKLSEAKEKTESLSEDKIVIEKKVGDKEKGVFFEEENVSTTQTSTTRTKEETSKHEENAQIRPDVPHTEGHPDVRSFDESKVERTHTSIMEQKTEERTKTERVEVKKSSKVDANVSQSSLIDQIIPTLIDNAEINDAVEKELIKRQVSEESQRSLSQDDSIKSPLEAISSSSSSGRRGESETVKIMDKPDGGEPAFVVLRHSRVTKAGDVESSSSGERSGSATLRAERRSGADFEAWSSSGESHYHSFEQTSDSGRTYSRPCSSDVEALMAGVGGGTTGSSEYESALTSQEISSRSTTTSHEYHTAVSSLSSRESMKSLDSESSGHLASIEVSSEASETLVPSALELEKDMEGATGTLIMDDDEYDRRDGTQLYMTTTYEEKEIVEPYDSDIPVHIIRGESTPKPQHYHGHTRTGSVLPALPPMHIDATSSEPQIPVDSHKPFNVDEDMSPFEVINESEVLDYPDDDDEADSSIYNSNESHRIVSQDSYSEDDKPHCMKRSHEMIFQPEPKAIISSSPLSDSSVHQRDDNLEFGVEDGSILSVSSTSETAAIRTMIELSRTDSDRMDASITSEQLSMTVSGTSEQLSLEDVEGVTTSHSHLIDSGTCTYQHAASDTSPSSVTIMTSSVDESGVQSVCTQVTSQCHTSDIEDEEDMSQTSQDIIAGLCAQNGPTQVDYVPEYDDFEETRKRPMGHRRKESTSNFVPSMLPRMGFDISGDPALISSASLRKRELEFAEDMAESDKYTDTENLTLKEVSSDEKKDVDEAERMEEESYQTEADQGFHRDLREGRVLLEDATVPEEDPEADIRDFDISRPQSQVSKSDSEGHRPMSSGFSDDRPDSELAELLKQCSSDGGKDFEDPIERPLSPEPVDEVEIKDDTPEFSSEAQASVTELEMEYSSAFSRSAEYASHVSPIREERTGIQYDEASSTEPAGWDIPVSDHEDDMAEAEAAFQMAPHALPTISTALPATILEEPVAEKHELETRDKALKEDRQKVQDIATSPGSIPDITVTQHMTPLLDKGFHYPDLELEDVARSAPQTPASMSSRGSSETETDQGREYVLEEDETNDYIAEEPEMEDHMEDKGAESRSIDDASATEDKTVYETEIVGELKERSTPSESPTSDSFEMLEKPDLTDEYVVIEEVGKEAEEHDSEGKCVHIEKQTRDVKKHDPQDDEVLISSPPPPATRMTDLKYYPDTGIREDDMGPFPFDSDSPPTNDGTKKSVGVRTDEEGRHYSYDANIDDSEYDRDVEAGKKWIEMQFQGDAAAAAAAGYGYEMDFERGPLEDIKEEEVNDFDQSSSKFGSIGSYKGSVGSFGSVKESLSSTPEYDVLAGRKFFTRSGEHDDVSLSSLQEFEHLEHQIALDTAKKRSHGSQDSLNGSYGSYGKRFGASRSGQGDDISLSSLKEFEGLESACIEAAKIESRAKEEEALLSEIEEGHESQVSESESYETMSCGGSRGGFGGGLGGGESVDSDDYEKRMFEIDEIIRQAQSNVERFVDPKDKIGGEEGTESSVLDRTESVGRGDSLEEVARVPELDLDQPFYTQHGILGSSTIVTTKSVSYHSQSWRDADEDIMKTSTDSLELKAMKSTVSLPHDSLHASTDSLDLKTVADKSGDMMTTSADSIELQIQLSNSGRADVMTDSMELPVDSGLMATSTDSLDLGGITGGASGTAMTDSIEEEEEMSMLGQGDGTGSGSGGHDQSSSSGREGDLSSSGKEDNSGDPSRVPPPRSDLMLGSTDSLDPSSSTATHATYQYETDSVMSSSFTSGGSNTMVSSTDTLDPSGAGMIDGIDIAAAARSGVWFDDGSAEGTPFVTEVIEPCEEEEFSHTIRRTVELPPEVRKVDFRGPDAERALKEYVEQFAPGEDVTESQEVDSEGNVHIKRVVQRRVVVRTEDLGSTQMSATDIEEYLRRIAQESSAESYTEEYMSQGTEDVTESDYTHLLTSISGADPVSFQSPPHSTEVVTHRTYVTRHVNPPSSGDVVATQEGIMSSQLTVEGDAEPEDVPDSASGGTQTTHSRVIDGNRITTVTTTVTQQQAVDTTGEHEDSNKILRDQKKAKQ